METPITFTWHATIFKHTKGLQQCYVVVPEEIATAFKEKSIKRVVIKILNQTFRRALQGDKIFGTIILMGQDLLKAIHKKEGDVMTITISTDINPDELDIPLCFQTILENDLEVNKIWNSFTVGRRRSLLVFIVSGNPKADTQNKRALKLAELIKTRNEEDWN